MTLDKLFKHGTEAAAHLFDQRGELLPMWLFEDAKGSLTPMVIHDMSDKDKVAEQVRAYIAKNKVTRYVCMLECWMVRGDPKTDIDKLMSEYRSLEHHPDRREAIQITAEDNKGNSISGCYYILRPEHGRAKLSPLEQYDLGKTEGRFTKMFT